VGRMHASMMVVDKNTTTLSYKGSNDRQKLHLERMAMTRSTSYWAQDNNGYQDIRGRICVQSPVVKNDQCRTGTASREPIMVKVIRRATKALRTTISHCARETMGLSTLVRGPNAGT
jgi:hypothetical protein